MAEQKKTKDSVIDWSSGKPQKKLRPLSEIIEDAEKQWHKKYDKAAEDSKKKAK